MKKSRVLSLALAAMLLVSALAGCSNTTTAGSTAPSALP